MQTPVWDAVLPDTQLPTSFLSFRSVLTYALPSLVSLPIPSMAWLDAPPQALSDLTLNPIFPHHTILQ